MNDISYNLERHIELLNHKKNALNQDKSFLKENQAEFLELVIHTDIVEQHLFWESRFDVASLMQTFLNKEITAEEFHGSVFGFRRNYLDKRDKFLSKLVSGEIKEFSPNKESYKLKGLLSSLYSICDDAGYEEDAEEFYDSIQNGFLKFQKILNEE